MAWGNSTEPENAGICYACHQKKQGTAEGTVGGAGFGSTRKKGLVAICVNPECSIGQKNLAKQQQA